MVILPTIAHRLGHYAAELRLCAALGASPASRIGLAAETCRFHLANRLRPSGRSGRPRRYAVRIAGRPAELWLRPLSGDFFVLHEIFVGECYHVPAAWRGDARCVVDLGANIGLTSLFLQRYFPQASFICVEPEPANAALLRRNTAALGGRALVLEAAVSDEPGEAVFDDGHPSWGGRLREGAAGGPRVRCLTMDEILALAPGGQIDLLKVDIEGAEARIFRGPCEWLRRVRALVIELHDPYSLERFGADMARHGLRVVPPDPALGNRQIFALNERWQPAPRHD